MQFYESFLSVWLFPGPQHSGLLVAGLVEVNPIVCL